MPSKTRRVRLCLEELEPRRLLSWVVADYGPWTLAGTNWRTGNPVNEPLDGGHEESLFYQAQDGSAWGVALAPHPFQPIQQPTPEMLAALTARYPNWAFSTVMTTLSD